MNAQMTALGAAAPHDAQRKPWVAACLSLLAPGVGHVYAGRLVAGLVLFAAASLLAPAPLAFVLAQPSEGMFWFLIGTIAASAALLTAAAVSAARVARRTPPGAPLREFQRPAVYLLLLAPGLLWSFGSAAALRGRFLRAYVIAAGSMEPTLTKGDRVLVNEMRLALRPLERGDVVVFDERASGQAWIKRVVGLPGDTVEIVDGDLRVNGRPLAAAGGAPEDGVREAIGGRAWTVRGTPGPLRPVVVPDGRCFVVGDDRDNSRDSRSIGPVPVEWVRGCVEYVYWAQAGDGPRVLPRTE